MLTLASFCDSSNDVNLKSLPLKRHNYTVCPAIKPHLREVYYTTIPLLPLLTNYSGEKKHLTCAAKRSNWQLTPSQYKHCYFFTKFRRTQRIYNLAAAGQCL